MSNENILKTIGIISGSHTLNHLFNLYNTHMAKAVVPINTPNKVQYFRPADDLWIETSMRVIPSVEIAQGAAVGWKITSNTTTGEITLMGVENAAGADFVGIMAEPIVSSDADYATSGKFKQVKVPTSIYSKAEFAVITGTFTAADVGKTVEFSSNSLGLAVDTAGKGARIVKYISSSRGLCTFPMPATETA